MKPNGFISFIIILIAIAILALLYVLTNKIATKSTPDEIRTITTPQRIEETQDVVNELQQKSIERQTIEIK
ncbi:hypothetical protein A3J17_03955 [Candidatus Curtissbacteria bacterium RIFCSPLOWO2_02_FULL_40_11]|uniref:Uncharacterized protein n=2 Tax=Candidatus Curtissiibacteriota TaxID=1752717 RepID=A0A1F5G701_9BACT|nr:MAG: hypothetical protein A2775_02285 [Candidatus Curtissbacteria bacterium RIFCSPHIGHO2_01_FULL_39_57]OGD87595.1 MAG: hypothetical protein A3D04_04945 [Candidatus Curtissbacteria bacterium RIFCSPHIGHO2_02_FULL_40_16b]OGD89977.1 MAG: hypothetical protein A3E11_02480 [Candidatus Curtissbacteria bacterium RIFCSPHIGHO2_12_FULL_38_37]OGE00681.1 MAG: hypothetical protein A3J17_03955 [Candidatus Curtissbacteria bacterium RIFCSPLOWO2_02_FULL_40_11]OGE13348.1 MAG: hypothetical protein A3G14_01580 [C